jgi:hypothetical protein
MRNNRSMSRIVLRNKTIYPDAEVRALVRDGFAGLDLDRRQGSILVRVNHTRISARRRAAGSRWVYAASGRAYPYVFVRPDVPAGAAWEMRLSVSRPDDFPVDWYDRHKHFTDLGPLRDWREALVAIAAHEGKHIELYQRMTPVKRHRRSALSGYAEESRCDAYAAKQVRRYRATH